MIQCEKLLPDSTVRKHLLLEGQLEDSRPRTPLLATLSSCQALLAPHPHTPRLHPPHTPSRHAVFPWVLPYPPAMFLCFPVNSTLRFIITLLMN